MAERFWFHRMVEHWSLPLRLDLVEHVKRAGVQVVQAGSFGPIFYGLADDPAVDRHWAGMPLVGVRENLEYAAALIPRLQEAGARVVGQMSMSWHYGDHAKRLGWFGAWERIWTDDLLGPAPCASPEDGHRVGPDGLIHCWPIEGRPYLTYDGCMCNPNWIAILKPMVKKAIELGVDGFNVHHNFVDFCVCPHCQAYVRASLMEHVESEILRQAFGTADLTDVEDVVTVREAWPEPLRQRLTLDIRRAAQFRRKEAFDEIFIHYGRSLKPGLLLAQWYHKYEFKPHDERSLLPGELWAKDEDYIWYSQGGHKGFSFLKHGYLADMGLPARFVYAAGQGRPFVLNKYDGRRWRLSIAEAAANHAAAPAYHWNHDDNPDFMLEDYCGPVIRYQRFLAQHEALFHPARPWSQVGLVYPRRGELAWESDCLDPLKRIGRVLEDRHVLFDILLDEQIVERAHQYTVLIVPHIRRLSDEERDVLRAFVREGGRLVVIGETDFSLSAEGMNHEWVLSIPDGPWSPDTVEPQPGVKVRVYPRVEEDEFGRTFFERFERLAGDLTLTTDAPWYVRVRAWKPEQSSCLVLHWVNYHQDEASQIEVPIPTGPIQVECRMPDGVRVERVEWLYPEMSTPTVLTHETDGQQVGFEIPSVIVYGLSVLHLEG